MGVFNFKKFAVVNERSAMKVNTDGVLLGAAMTIKETDRTMLDVGTGTGTIALMAAQRWVECHQERCSERHPERHPERYPERQACAEWHPELPLRHPELPLRHPELDSGSVSEGIPNQVWNDVQWNDVQWNDVEQVGRAENQVWIDAIDIDEASAEEAGMNFKNSLWGGNMKAHHCSLDEFAVRLTQTNGIRRNTLSTASTSATQPTVSPTTGRRYDLIFSNPPYFEDSLPAPEERRCNARHTKGLSYRELIEFSAERLTGIGRFSIVLPADQETALTRYARMNGLHLFRIIRIRTVPRKAPNRIIAEFSRQRCETPEESILTIQNEGKYTQEYLSLTRDFYLFA